MECQSYARCQKQKRSCSPVVCLILIILLVPRSAPHRGMFMFGNLLRVSGAVERLSDTAQNAFINSITILLMLFYRSK